MARPVDPVAVHIDPAVFLAPHHPLICFLGVEHDPCR